MRSLLAGGLVCFVLSCTHTSDELEPFPFKPARVPATLSTDRAHVIVQGALREHERATSVSVRSAIGYGKSVVEVVAVHDRTEAVRSFVVDEAGVSVPTREFWVSEEAARISAFGKLTPELHAIASSALPTDRVDVEIFASVSVPDPQRPFDGTDQYVPISAYEDWLVAQSQAQQLRVTNGKARLLAFLIQNGATITENARGLPTIRASVPVLLLLSNGLNASDVASIYVPPEAGHLLADHAGRVSMASTTTSGGVYGGVCGGVCDGGHVDVGLWERDSATTIVSGIGRNNSRVTGGLLTGYRNCPTPCNSDADCADVTGTDTVRYCRNAGLSGNKICVQDHLTWIAASVGMVGSYNYTTGIPGGADPVANSFETFSSTGAWRVDFRVGNDRSSVGLDYLIAPPDPAPTGSCQSNAIPTPYVNRSVSGTPLGANWAARAFGTFITAASGNSAEIGGHTQCATLKNGLCVGAYDHFWYPDLPSHRRASYSTFVNDPADASVERPHITGPGSHQSNSGLHMPSIDVATGANTMRHASYEVVDSKYAPIRGTSFAAPAVLSAAIQAHQFEGWFSALAFPQVNKAVLLASTTDANNDGAIGKGTVWSQNAPTLDSEDGAGQVREDRISTILTNNTYLYRDLVDADFVSCGASCRELVAASINVPANYSTRVAVAWHTCQVSSADAPFINNDLDLVLSCGSQLQPCGGSIASTSTASELEMVHRGACHLPKSCSIRIRIKNGASLASCGSTTTERIGLAWSFNN